VIDTTRTSRWASFAEEVCQSQVPGSLYRSAQDQVDFELQDNRIERVAPEDHLERTCNAPVDVKSQLARTFWFEREAVARFERPRRIARLKGAKLNVSRFPSRHYHCYGVIDSECAACLESIER
jgi:hypothetical protein